MRRISHVTPRYIVDRAITLVQEKMHPREPWIVRQASMALSTLLRPTDTGFEFGSGRSTAWFAGRIAHLTSVEDNPSWHRKVARDLEAAGVDNVTYIGVDRHEDPVKAADIYTAPIRDLEDESLDFVMIDGAHRGICTYYALPKLRSGALLVIDNVERYLPSGSRAPGARYAADGPAADDNWPDVWNTIQHWRVIWMTSGVWDTAIFFKPCN